MGHAWGTIGAANWQRSLAERFEIGPRHPTYISGSTALPLGGHWRPPKQMDQQNTVPENAAVLLAALAQLGVFEGIEAAQSVVGFDIPEPQQATFLRFHRFATEPQPDYITAWRSDPTVEKWYHRHVNGVLGDVRGGLAAAYYHQSRLAELEHNLVAALQATGIADRLGNGMGMGFGATRKLDFEYQAFILACRRTLDYLAGALAAYFKTEASSFRKLPKSINAGKPSSVSAAIKDAHSRHVGDLDYIMAEGRQSVRNRIAHYEFVSAGTININQRGLMLVGGGEGLGGFGNPDREARLQDILTARLERLHTCVGDMIDSFIDAARNAPAATQQSS